MIGIVGGVGPHAGLYLAKNVLDQTIAETDQDHLPLVLLSTPNKIRDRTEFLLGRNVLNPAQGIYQVIERMERIGAEVVGIACNTAHAPIIYSQVTSYLNRDRSKIKLLNIIDEVMRFIKEHCPYLTRIGVLSTMGVYQTELYKEALEKAGIEQVLPNEEWQYAINECIYGCEYGIKAHSNPVTDTARRILLDSVQELAGNGAQAVILGCTELPLALPESNVNGTLMIDSTLVLARALIRESAPHKLRTLEMIHQRMPERSIQLWK